MSKATRRLPLLCCLLTLTLPGCSSEREEARATAVDTLTRRQKDEIISKMPVRGGGVVGKALRVSDSLAARAERHDTL